MPREPRQADFRRRENLDLVPERTELSCDLTGGEPGPFREQDAHGGSLALTGVEIHVATKLGSLMFEMGHQRTWRPRNSTSALPPKADSSRTSGHVRFVPCVDGSGLARTFFALQAWSVPPCVRPVDAVHMTAGHNALRGSGPGQKHAFDDAMAQVGCPDRRIDRLCITCCSPSQPSHHAD